MKRNISIPFFEKREWAKEFEDRGGPYRRSIAAELRWTCRKIVMALSDQSGKT